MKNENILIKPWSGKLTCATLVERPHRFAINIVFKNHKQATAHCVNSGRGEGMLRRGSKVWVSKVTNKDRALQWTWEMSFRNGCLVGSNSVTANHLIGGLLAARTISKLRSARKILRERKVGKKRIDFEVVLTSGRRHFIEVKNCHLRYADGRAYFPDSESSRSHEHLLALRSCIRAGHRASLFIAIQRIDITTLRPSDFHDPKFSRALRRAHRYGVQVRAFCFKPTLEGFVYHGEIKVDLEEYSLTKIIYWSKQNAYKTGWNFYNSSRWLPEN